MQNIAARNVHSVTAQGGVKPSFGDGAVCRQEDIGGWWISAVYIEAAVRVIPIGVKHVTVIPTTTSPETGCPSEIENR